MVFKSGAEVPSDGPVSQLIMRRRASNREWAGGIEEIASFSGSFPILSGWFPVFALLPNFSQEGFPLFVLCFDPSDSYGVSRVPQNFRGCWGHSLGLSRWTWQEIGTAEKTLGVRVCLIEKHEWADEVNSLICGLLLGACSLSAGTP